MFLPFFDFLDKPLRKLSRSISQFNRLAAAWLLLRKLCSHAEEDYWQR